MKDEHKVEIKRPQRQVVRVVVHCAATPEGRDFRMADIDRWHRAKGWNGCGYHYVVDLDGKIEKGRDLEDLGAHAGVYNRGSIGVCYIGGLDKDGEPKDTRTAAQKESLLWLLGMLRYLYPGVEIVGHRDLPDVKKACPCFDARREYRNVRAILR